MHDAKRYSRKSQNIPTAESKRRGLRQQKAAYSQRNTYLQTLDLLKVGEDMRWNVSQGFKHLVQSRCCFITNWNTGPRVSWRVGCSAKVTIKNQTPLRRALCRLHEHNSFSEDHPVLQDEAKTVPAKRISVLFTLRSPQTVLGLPLLPVWLWPR